MRGHRRAVPRLAGVAAVALWVAGCLGSDPEQPTVPGAPPASPDRPRLSDQTKVRFGASGELLPSDTTVAGLPLPRGSETTRESEREHVYAIRAPLEKVQAYFGPRLLTSQVTRIGSGIVYREATPKGVRGGEVKLDVSILPRADGAVRVEVVELPPVPPELDDTARRARFERVQRDAPVLD